MKSTTQDRKSVLLSLMVLLEANQVLCEDLNEESSEMAAVITGWMFITVVYGLCFIAITLLLMAICKKVVFKTRTEVSDVENPQVKDEDKDVVSIKFPPSITTSTLMPIYIPPPNYTQQQPSQTLRLSSN